MDHRRKMKDGYRRFFFLSDIGGIKNTIGEMRGIGHPEQPSLNKASKGSDSKFEEAWFISTLRDKIASHPDNSMEYPFYGEKIFDESLIDFVRGDDPIFTDFKRIICPHHFTPYEIMAWQAEKNGVAPPEARDLSFVLFVMPITKRTNSDKAKQTGPRSGGLRQGFQARYSARPSSGKLLNS